MTEQPVLRDGELTIAPPGRADAALLMEIDADAECQRWLDFPMTLPPPDEHRARAERVIEAWERESTAGSRLPFIVRVGDERVGTVELQPQGPSWASVSYTVLERHRGRGYATRALSLLCAWGFDELGLEHLRATVDVDNARSQALVRALGFAVRETLISEKSVEHYEPQRGERRTFVVYELSRGSGQTSQ